MEVTEFGIVIEVRDEQPLKVKLLISVIVLEIAIDLRDSQS